MKKQLSYFTRKQRGAFVLLALLIIMLQVVLFYTNQIKNNVAHNYQIDLATQQKIDSLKLKAYSKNQLQPFNPNFINDAKGFRLGMSVQEIDKLLAYRAMGKYVNSANEFQQVTGVSNELLDKISPYFKFPEWTQTPKQTFKTSNVTIKKIDINTATYQDLVAIKGIGDYYANLVMNERDKLNGFLSLDQLNYINQLRPEANLVLKQNTYIGKKPLIIKININKASK